MTDRRDLNQQQVDVGRLKVLFKSAKLLVLLLRLENRHGETTGRQIILSKSAFQIKLNPFSILNILTLSVVVQQKVFANSAYLNFIFSFSETYCGIFCKIFSILSQKVIGQSSLYLANTIYSTVLFFLSPRPQLFRRSAKNRLKANWSQPAKFEN